MTRSSFPRTRRISAARRHSRVASVDHARAEAERVLPRVVFDFVDGGAERELTMSDNRSAFEEVRFRQSVAVDVGTPDLATSVLGTRLSLPVAFAPCGMLGVVHPDGEPAVARAAAAQATVAAFSTFSSTPLEEIAASSSGPKWFQLYFLGGRDGADELIDRARAAAYDALVLTVDTAVAGHRERDARNGVTYPLDLGLRSALKFGPGAALHPGWLYRFARARFPLAVANGRPLAGSSRDDLGAAIGGSPPTWDDMSWIRDQWRGPILVKGVMTGDDARRALDAGADGVIVSNHGGRQLDGVPATIRVLPEIVHSVGGAAPVLIDSGIRRGSDVVAAVALGATAVLIGRPYVYGLAIGGQAGVERVTDMLRGEIVRTMQLLGCRSLTELGPEHLWQSPTTGAT